MVVVLFRQQKVSHSCQVLSAVGTICCREAQTFIVFLLFNIQRNVQSMRFHCISSAEWRDGYKMVISNNYNDSLSDTIYNTYRAQTLKHRV